VDDTVVTVSSSRAITAVAERVAVTVVGATVGAVPVWETFTFTVVHVGVVGTSDTIFRS